MGFDFLLACRHSVRLRWSCGLGCNQGHCLIVFGLGHARIIYNFDDYLLRSLGFVITDGNSFFKIKKYAPIFLSNINNKTKILFIFMNNFFYTNIFIFFEI